MKNLVPIFLAVSLIGVLGCRSADSDRDRYDRIAKSLDTGGSAYFISSSRHAGAAVEDIFKKNEEALWSSSLPAASRFKLQHFISCSELFGRVAGLHEIKGWGGSSRQIPGTDQVLFRNKFRILLPQAPGGVFWQTLSAKNRPLEKYLDNLPDDTFFAGAIDLPLRSLERVLNAEKNLTVPAANICKIFFNMTPREILNSLSGVWRIVVVCDEENDPQTLAGIHIALTVPDRGNKLFKNLCSRLKHLPNTNINAAAGVVKLAKFPGKMCIPYIRRNRESMTFYTSPLAVRRTSNGSSFPHTPSFLKKLARHSVLEGFGIFYSRNTAPGTNFSKDMDMETVAPSLTFVKKLSDGILVEDISSCDFNHYGVNFLAALPLKLVFEFISAPDSRERAVPNRAAPSPKPPRNKTIEPSTVVPARSSQRPAKTHKNCPAAIKYAGEKLTKSVSASTTWPVPGIAGLRHLVSKKILTAAMLRCPEIRLTPTAAPGMSYANCHYLYFGKPGKGSPKSPLLMELPFLHRNHFSVFYADGSVEKIQMDGRRNVRRAVSYLHTVHSYDEEEFIRLMHRASEFDKILER